MHHPILSKFFARALQALRCALSLGALCGLLAAAGPAHAATASAASAASADAGPLVSAAWLQRHRAQPGLHIVDASPPPQHRQQHITGAVPADFMTLGAADLPSARVQQRLRDWGVNEGDVIVIVDAGGTWQAARLFWDLVHHGLPAAGLRLLDGGMAAWVAAGGEVTQAATPTPAPGQVRLGAVDPSVRVRLPEFLAASADPARHVLLDALDPDYYYGGAAWFHRGGHVPQATLLPAGDFYNADKTFKPAAEMRRMLAHLGIRPEQTVLTHCGGGGAAAVPFFALKYLLGHGDVRMFQESQLGWVQDPRDLPLWTYAAPTLWRDTPWLRTWASPMFKGMGLSKVSVVDVRPAADFALGHVPLALNLPALAAPGAAELTPEQRDQWRRQLDLAGIPPEHEAVVLADGGLNAAAASAFLALEQLGQRRVSIYMDSVELWAAAGGELNRPRLAATSSATSSAASSAASSTSSPTAMPTSAAAPVSARRPAAAAVAPAARFVDATTAGQGVYVPVYVDAGATPSARSTPGTRVHLPAAQLLQSDGRPKPAKDLWKLMAAAGVPRYARIVLYADAPGDAAINYVVFRLMGFADLSLRAPAR